MDKLETSLRKAFIDKNNTGSELDPQLVINQPDKHEFLLNLLQEQLEQCQSFLFSIAFITPGGLNAIKTQLADLNRKGVKGRLLTSDYLAFNAPETFQELLKIPNLDVRISPKSGFHAKGYLFYHENYKSFIIGSSNLTMTALKTNYEWNVFLTSYDHGEILHQLTEHIEMEWQLSTLLTKEWIIQYAENYQPITRGNLALVAEKSSDSKTIQPNKMQSAALEQLEQLRESGEHRGMVISATGTGKTYLAALDARQCHPDRLLFIVHREQILHSALKSFHRVIGGPIDNYGILSGNSKDYDKKYLFATIQTISKPDVYKVFNPEAFDYILIDEVHRSGTDSYLRTIDYFQPQFLLGMTATPERTDNFNIYELFDNNVAYEIRLQDALNEELLCPFYYFGVTDFEKNGETIDETTQLQQLVSQERVDFVLEKIAYYETSGVKTKGLVFCSRREECYELARLFNERGKKSVALTGQTSMPEREEQVKRLENGELEYIFTVDIFNEGIDIPAINQVIMLRNTQSTIVFTQQLGRGLRKSPNKEFVTIIDFIGNYSNNYMIPMALMGDYSNDLDNIRRGTLETQYISGISAVNMEQIAKKRIFEAIDQFKPDDMRQLKEKYLQLKNRLNRVPLLADFKATGTLDPELLASKNNKGYYFFLQKMEKDIPVISKKAETLLKFMHLELIGGKRLNEVVLLERLLSQKEISLKEIVNLFNKNGLRADDETVHSTLQVLSLTYYVSASAKRYAGCPLITITDNGISLSNELVKALEEPMFYDLFMDSIETAKLNGKDYDQTHMFTMYEKYTRDDALQLANFKEQVPGVNIGGYKLDKERHLFLIFVTLDKGDDFQGAQVKYGDELLSQQAMHWYSKAPRNLQSPEIKILKHEDNWNILMFVQKRALEQDKKFYYLGRVQPQRETITQTTVINNQGKGTSVVHMQLDFEQTLPLSLYKYLKN